MASQSDKPVLPVLGAMYWLKASESSWFVHPKGGSDNPGDGSPLLFHVTDRRNNLRFKFVKVNNITFLQHVTSGKYIHTENNNLTRGARLFVHSGVSNIISGIELVTIDGYTYLRNSSNHNFFVHPRGGTAGENVELIWHDGVPPPRCAISIVPAEEYEVVSMEFDTSSKLTDGVLIAVQEGPSNNSIDTELACSTTVSYSESIANEFTFSFSQELGVEISTTFKAGIPLAEASTTATFSAKFGASQSKTTNTTETVSMSITRSYVLKPRTWGKLVLTTKKKSGKIPFKAILRSAKGNQFEQTGVVDIKYFFNTKDTLETGPIA